MTGAGPRPLVAVLVGTDHHPFTRVVDWSSALAAEGWADWFVQHGTAAWPEAPPPNLRGARVIDQATLREVIARAQCVVCHAGPGLLMDAASAGHRPIVVPRDPALGEHVDGHQLDFARRMAEAGRIDTAEDLGSLRTRVRAALSRPRQVSPGALEPSPLCERFGDLVATAVARRRSALVR